MRDRLERESVHRIPALILPLVLSLLLAALGFLPRVSANWRLAASFWGASAVLLVLCFLLRQQVIRPRRKLRYEFVPLKVHYVQALMQSCVYVYWGFYWPEVFRHAWLILAQIAFVYGLDMLVSWRRRDTWVLGFGPFPIILSTNLFLWFRDDWFFLQFLMVGTGVLIKEFAKWKRDDRLTHIFNPSAAALFIFSVGLLVTNKTPISWGEDISATLHRPPHIYLEVFLVGLVVQALFSVTLVTLWAAAALCALNLAYTHATGTYHFIDSNIPVSVFLGLHLLITDPATSPRTGIGKVLFGGSYGAAVFGMYGLLAWVGAPTFYDKLLCVPALNLCVPALDRVSRAVTNRFAIVSTWTRNPQRYNLAHMAVWLFLFAAMSAGGFLAKGKDHPGSNPAFWEQACQKGEWNACKTWVRVLNVSCRDDSAVACYALGRTLEEGRIVPKNFLEAGKSFGRACDLGLGESCLELINFLRSGGRDVFLQGCESRDGASCFILGSLATRGLGIPRDPPLAFDLFQRSCSSGWPRGCGRLGESYLWGEGTAADATKALESFNIACRGKFAPGCFNEAMMYRRGIGAPRNETAAQERLQQACDLGLQPACGQREGASLAVTRSGSSP